MRNRIVVADDGSTDGTIQKFIDYNFWDEARCFVGKKKIYDGIKAPEIKNKEWIKKTISTDLLYSVINYSPNKL